MAQVDTPADRRAEVEVETLSDTVAELEVKKRLNTLGDRLAEIQTGRQAGSGRGRQTCGQNVHGKD